MWLDLNNEGVRRVQAGDPAGARPLLLRALDATDDPTERASTLVNLAAVADWSGDPARAVDLLTEAAQTAGAAGDEVVRTNALAARAQVVGRSGVDEPEALLALATVLVTTGRFAEAAEVAGTALAHAYASAPALAAPVHLVLAEIAGTTGDNGGSAEQLALALDLAEATADHATAGRALIALARLAYLASDNTTAEAHYDRAEAALRLAGDERQLLACTLGRAAVRISLGHPREALALLDRVGVDLGPVAAPVALVAVHQLHGGAREALGDYERAEEHYATAAAVGAEAGLWHLALGIAWWRADALVRWASTVEGARRRELSALALDLALPAALAAEAVRHRFGPGALRERWVALAAAPATRSALTAIAAVGDVGLAAEYLDHLGATVTLSGAESAGVGARDELLSLPVPPERAEASLPYAASSLLTAAEAGHADVGLALPPRVRLDPAVRTALDDWIDRAEHRFGFPVRAPGAVASW